MKFKNYFFAAAMAAALCGCAEQKPANPLFSDFTAPFGIAPFEEITIDHFREGMLKGLEEQKAEIEAIINNTDLQLSFRLTTGHIPDNLRIIAKIQLTAPGLSSHRGRFRNYVGTKANNNHVSFIIHDYRTVSGLDLNEYQVHLRHLLIDSNSGHRSKETPLSAAITI